MAEASPPECPICYSAIVEHPNANPTGSTKTSCGHTFHPGCLATWYLTEPSCPYCRAQATELEKPRQLAPVSNKNFFDNYTYVVTIDEIMASQLDVSENAVNNTFINTNLINNNIITNMTPIEHYTYVNQEAIQNLMNIIPTSNANG
jgi:hypothetical protein